MRLLACLLALTACAQPPMGAADWQSPRPAPRNVVVLMADDLGWGDVGYHRHLRIQTPHLDRMAADGLRIERFYAAAPVCSPTRGSCLTGRHPYRLGIPYANRGHLAAAETTLAEVLGAHGWATGHFGKWHLGTLTTTVRDSNRGGPEGRAHYAPPWEHGFEVCFSTEAKVPTFDPMVNPDNGESYGTAYWNERGEQVTDNLGGDDSARIMDQVLPFVEASVAADRPFLAVVWFHTPHLPVLAGSADRAPFADLPAGQQHYYGAIRAMDREIGRLRDRLAALGVAEDTLLCFWSDNGPEGRAGRAPGSTGGLRGRKRDLYEGGIRVPGLMVWPRGIAAGRRTTTPMVSSDLLPTLCDLLDIELPAVTLDGLSLHPWLLGSSAPRPRGIGFESRDLLAWIDNDWKLIGHLTDPAAAANDQQIRWDLYNLDADPSESQDRYADHPLVAARLVSAALAWRQERRQESSPL